MKNIVDSLVEGETFQLQMWILTTKFQAFLSQQPPKSSMNVQACHLTVSAETSSLQIKLCISYQEGWLLRHLAASADQIILLTNDTD